MGWGEDAETKNDIFLERESVTSLYIYGRSDRRNSSEQEG